MAVRKTSSTTKKTTKTVTKRKTVVTTKAKPVKKATKAASTKKATANTKKAQPAKAKKVAAPKAKAPVVKKPTIKKVIETKSVPKENLKVISSTNYVIGTDIKPYVMKKNEEYMNDNQLNHFKKILEHWKMDLMMDAESAITNLKEVNNYADPNDRATEEENLTLRLKEQDRKRKLIKKIEGALQQIKEKEYGYCEGCGIEIGIRRLEARPTAQLCIDCKTLDEIREKRAAT